MRTYKIYYLEDPRDGAIRYIGKTVRILARRLSNHLTPEVLMMKNHRGAWVKQLTELGLRPTIHLLQEFRTEREANRAEIYWIKYFRDQGCNLVNGTDGGEGSKGRKLSPEAIARISRKMRLFRHTEAAKKLMKANGSGKWPRTREHIVQNSRKQGGRQVMDGRGKIFQTTAEAARYHGLLRERVRDTCKGRSKTAGGLTFRYV